MHSEEMVGTLRHLWCRDPGLTMKRLTKILYQRGIEGVIVDGLLRPGGGNRER